VSNIDVLVGPHGSVAVTLGKPAPINVEVGTSGKPGKQGEPGPEGGTPVVAVPYNQWPPANPTPDTLYLRLAP
jgi:hypothetical protein